VQQAAQLFDHLIRSAGQRQRDSDAKRLSRLEIDDQINFCILAVPVGLQAFRS
jgi:hypothetical protein